MLTAMVLSAGFGTRLRPLTDELPKALVPVGDRPLLSHILQQLLANGVNRALINTHHLPHHFDAVVRASPIPVEVLYEPSLLGTAGGVAQARERIGSGPVIVHNGDILSNLRLGPLLAALTKSDVALVVAGAAARVGSVGVGSVAGQGSSGGRRGATREGVARLRGEVFGEVERETDYVGVLGLSTRALAELPPTGCLMGDVVLPRLRAGQDVAVVETDEAWTDVGTVESYWEANLKWLTATVPKGKSWLGRGASVDGRVTLVHSVIGAQARVEGAGRLENCVVWPGAVAVAPLANAIVSGQGRVVQL